MVKKGLSLEEKRAKVLAIFHEADEVFQLKEIEKLASKQGVVLQSVKEVVQSLVDDDMVHQDKIGIGNFLWAFAAEASTKVRNDQAKLEAALTSAQEQLADTEQQVQAASEKLDDAELQQQLAGQIQEQEDLLAKLETECASMAAVDPERFQAQKEAALIARDSANRWLDNTYTLKDWCQKSFSGREQEVAGFFAENGLTDTIDYLT